MSRHAAGSDGSRADDPHATARHLAERLSAGFRAHDKGRREAALEAFHEIDSYQFPDLEAADTRLAAEAFVDALWAKDDVEFGCLRNGALQVDDLRTADYSPVKQRLRQRASLIGADPKYAETKAEAWRKHKTGEDYWTPFGWSQVYELRAVLDDPGYPRKPRGGQSGIGPGPMRYVLAFELHDMHTERHWQEGVSVMVPYYVRILESHGMESYDDG